MGVSSQRYPKVNIVSNDYGRYGTSVYQKLYSRNNAVNDVNTYPYGRNQEAAPACRNAASTGSAICDENPLIETATFCSTATSTTRGANDGTSSADEGRSVDIASVVDVAADSSSRRLKIKKYRSLISSSSKKLINRLHEHGSSDTFSIFSLRTSQSHKHELMRSEPIIHEVRTLPSATFQSLPVEIVANILLMLGDECQHDLVNCLYVSRTFYNATKMVLYREPMFTSTYRVAQFVTSLRLHPENGMYVRTLDLSRLKNGLVAQDTDDDPSRDFTDPQSSSDMEDADYEYALASWRDWRYRHDSLYGAAALNSYNLKKVVSRASSISSQATSSGISSASGGHGHCSTASSLHPRGHRSNSSVSSFTSSIMSSLQNSSHLSLVSTFSTANEAGHSQTLNRTNKSHGLSRRRPADGKTVLNNKKLSEDDESTMRDSLWLRIRRGPRYRRLLKAKKATQVTNQMSAEENTESLRRNILVKFDISPPFKTCHPYANKFLLKYAPYRDLPIGYILHMLKLCPNITSLDLSHLVLCPDFEIIGKKPPKIMNCTSLLPAVQESATSVGEPEADLEVVYLTDSNKNYDYYTGVPKGSSPAFNQNAANHLTAGNDMADPLPLDALYKRRSLNRRVSTSDIQLRQMNPAEVFEFLCANQLGLSLRSVRMDGIVWCRENMIKYFVMKTFKENNGKQLQCSFDKAGLNMNLAWTCCGQLDDFVSLLVMIHISHMDDLALRDVFNVFPQSPTKEKFEIIKDPEILEISNVFAIEYCLDSRSKQSVEFRVTVLKSDRPTSYRIRRLLPSHVSLVVNLRLQDNSSNQLDEELPEPSRRLHSLTYAINSRLRELRNDDLRRNLGENNFFMGSAL
ncbi:hypothetical protein HG536_0D01200 [Torulaspora globosa]|uniref:F-box domain-containing protein n=1 Tax=Torulaspora globosa TaxID=48254 RepID=A0A7G3ZGG2_9SACH|nr:uncharacterized protein HG536_0D01200 [Torulaspora globosa]QLL32598.1 hypothetical protein HG536_0D01200 [Torulaspora globosa]